MRHVSQIYIVLYFIYLFITFLVDENNVLGYYLLYSAIYHSSKIVHLLTFLLSSSLSLSKFENQIELPECCSVFSSSSLPFFFLLRKSNQVASINKLYRLHQLLYVSFFFLLLFFNWLNFKEYNLASDSMRSISALCEDSAHCGDGFRYVRRVWSLRAERR